MKLKVVEISSSCNVGVYSPRKVLAVVVKVTRRNGETYLYIEYFADLWQQFPYFLEIGQVAAVVCHKAGNAGLA